MEYTVRAVLATRLRKLKCKVLQKGPVELKRIHLHTADERRQQQR